jgi:hypothetical protein
MCCLRDKISHGRDHLSVSAQETCEPVPRLAHGAWRQHSMAGRRWGERGVAGGQGAVREAEKEQGFCLLPPHLLPHASTIDGWDWLGSGGQDPIWLGCCDCAAQTV